jgi:TldD protein
VVLAAGSAGILLHEAIGHGLEADFNRKRTSVYSDRLGTAIAPPEVTIVDDATCADARGSVNVDDEGADGERTVLVEGGRLRSYMHDRISARHYGVSPTGNGRRQSFRHVPLPRMRNTYMLAGPHDPEEIVRSVRYGVYAQTFTNGQVQIGAGDFTFYIKTGYLIENGRFTRPIKDTNIIGNGPQCLANVEQVGSDFRMDEGGWTCGKDGQSVPVSLGMPTVKVRAITVGGV